MTDRKITVTEASRHFSEVVNRTYYRGESTILMRSGEPVAKVVPICEDSVLGRDWLAAWHALPHLAKEDADAFAAEMKEDRKNLVTPETEWD